MTTTDPATHTAHAAPDPDLDAGQPVAEHDWATYAASQFDAQKRAGVAVSMDVQIASEIALTFETRGLRYDVQALAATIHDLERVLADHTATMQAFLTQQGGLFGVEEAEAAIEQLPAPEQQT